MLKNSKLIISIVVAAIIVVVVLMCSRKDDETVSSDITISPQQSPSNSEKTIPEPAPIATSPNLPPANQVASYREISRRNDNNVDSLANSQGNQHSLQVEDMLGLQPKRNISPEIAAKINQVTQNAIVSLGYDKIDSLKLTRIYSTTEQDSFSDSSTLLDTKTSYESYVQPNWMRREIYKGEYKDPLMIEVITDDIVIQKKASDNSIANVNIFETFWYNYSNHPLMLHHELNSSIYESLDIRELSTQEAEAIGAKDAAERQIAILKTVSDTSRKDHKFWCEIWVDLENGHILNNIMYDHDNIYDRDKIIMQTQDYIYKEVSDGVFCPVGRKIISYKPDGSKRITEEKVVDIEINTTPDKNIPLIFRY